MRVSEVLRLRIMDIDFEQMEISVRSGKGDKDRRTMLPEKSIAGLKHQIELSNQLFNADMQQSIDFIHLPGALLKKLPNAGKDFRWRYVFSSHKLSKDPTLRANW